eukprot:1005571-Prymnesium_polylepis.1
MYSAAVAPPRVASQRSRPLLSRPRDRHLNGVAWTLERVPSIHMGAAFDGGARGEPYRFRTGQQPEVKAVPRRRVSP